MRSPMNILIAVRRQTIALALATAGASVCVSAQVAAQSPISAPQPTASSGMRGIAPTRAELQAMAVSAESLSQASGSAALQRRKLIEAASIRERLRDGDFQTGDRIVIEILGAEAPLIDTTTVRAARMIYLANMPPISLQGVLRSEIEDHLKAQVGKYIREPQVTATSLIQIVVSGSVGKTGFYWVPSDILLSDAIMMAGISSGGDLNKTTIKRGKQEIWPKEQVRQALRQGMTIDQLNVRAGDEINIGAQSVRYVKTNFFGVTSVLTLIWTLRRLSNGGGGF
jgi:hypothetical protein